MTSKTPLPGDLEKLVEFMKTDEKLKFLTQSYRLTGKKTYKADAPLFAPACYLEGGKGQDYWFTDEEIERQNRHNSKFETPRLEQELVDLYFRKPSEGETGEFVSVARAMQIIGCNITQKLSSQKTGRAFSDLGFKRFRNTRCRGFIAIIRTAEEIRNYQISQGIDASSNLPF